MPPVSMAFVASPEICVCSISGRTQTASRLVRDAPQSHHGLSHTAGSFCEAGPYVCETTKPLACDV